MAGDYTVAVLLPPHLLGGAELLHDPLRASQGGPQALHCFVFTDPFLNVFLNRFVLGGHGGHQFEDAPLHWRSLPGLRAQPLAGEQQRLGRLRTAPLPLDAQHRRPLHGAARHAGTGRTLPAAHGAVRAGRAGALLPGSEITRGLLRAAWRQNCPHVNSIHRDRP